MVVVVEVVEGVVLIVVKCVNLVVGTVDVGGVEDLTIVCCTPSKLP